MTTAPLDAFEAVMLAIAIAMGVGYLAVCVAAVAHYLVGAARPAPVPPAQSWAARVDPDHLLPPALPRPTLLVIDHGRVVRVVPGTDRVAPPREASPEVRRG